MHVSIQAAAFLVPAIIAVGAIPYPTASEQRRPAPVEETTILWQNEDHSSVKFEAPCHGCFIGADEGLVFDLTIHPSEVRCGASNVELNGKPLDQRWDGMDAWGSGTITTQLSSGLGTRAVTADWQISCLLDLDRREPSNALNTDATQLLTFTISQIGHDNVDHVSGFTVSFKQQSNPEVLRLETTPVPISYEPAFTSSWRSPPPALHLSPTAGIVTEPLALNPYGLESEVRALQDLQAQHSNLKWQIRERKTRIALLMKQDFHSSIKKCEGISCVFRTLLDHGPKAFTVMTSHGHRHPQPPFPPLECHEGDSPHPCGPPPQGPPPRGYHPHFHPPPHRRALMRTMHAAKAICFLLGIASFITIIVRKFKYLFSPKRKADRAVRRSERRASRAYRRAARRHQWSKWWNRYRQPRNTSDYEEKRAMIMSQESILEDDMQREICALRHAHELVNDLVRAEEGRMSSPIPVPGASPVELEAGEGMTLSFRCRRTDSLPDYRSETGMTEPPEYEEEIGGEVGVADGLMYSPGSLTPSGTGSTPGSSVVDCSPRLSAETGRTVETTRTGFTKG